MNMQIVNEGGANVDLWVDDSNLAPIGLNWTQTAPDWTIDSDQTATNVVVIALHSRPKYRLSSIDSTLSIHFNHFNSNSLRFNWIISK